MTSQQSATTSSDAMGTRPAATAADARAMSTPARIARRVYVLGVYLLGLVVLAQFLFAGLGIFFDYEFLALWHAIVGAGVIVGLSLVLIPIGLLGRVAGRTLWLTASVIGLVLVQSALLVPFHSDASGLVRAISGLHVINALLIFWVVLRLVARASSLRST